MTETATDTREQEAARDLERAEQGVREVLERIKDADEKIGPEDLEAAESRVRFARARIEGEKRRQAEEAERARLARIDALKQRALALDPGALRKLEGKARRALDAYAAAATAYKADLNEIGSELHTLEPLPDDLDLAIGANGHSLRIGSEHRPTERPITVCASAAKEALRTHIPRGFIDLERPSD